MQMSGFDMYIINPLPPPSFILSHTLTPIWVAAAQNVSYVAVSQSESIAIKDLEFLILIKSSQWCDILPSLYISVYKISIFLFISKSKAFSTQHIMIPMGDDFQYSNAHQNYKNMDKLLAALARRVCMCMCMYFIFYRRAFTVQIISC